MRNVWNLFMGGLCGSALFCVLISKAANNNPRSPDDPRVKKIDDTSISGLKTQVPLVKEMESGLAAREAEVAERERRLKETQEQLSVEEARVKDQIDELNRIQDEIVRRQKENRKVSQDVLQKLVKTYESMAPKKAAGVISVMSDDLAVDLLMAMKEKKVAGILDVMDPNRAMTLSTLVAKRRPAGKLTGEDQARPQSGEGPPVP